MNQYVHTIRKLVKYLVRVRVSVDGCYSSKFLRSSARRFLLEILYIISPRQEVRSSARRTSPLTMVLSYVADLPRGFASCYLEKVMKRQWGSRRDTTIWSL